MKNRSVKMIILAQIRSVEEQIFWMRSQNALMKEWLLSILKHRIAPSRGGTPAYLQTRLDEDKTSNAMAWRKIL